jgi:hypothetical protein
VLANVNGYSVSTGSQIEKMMCCLDASGWFDLVCSIKRQTGVVRDTVLCRTYMQDDCLDPSVVSVFVNEITIKRVRTRF